MLNKLELLVTRYRTGTTTDVVVVIVVVVDNGRKMSGYVTKEEKRKYEQSRRAQVMQDARDHRLLTGWLTRVQPDTLARFYAFKAGLQGQYPARKDLAKAPAFIQFMYGEGDVQIPTMIVPLMDMFQQDQRPLKPELATPLENIEIVAESTTSQIPKPEADSTGPGPLNDNPFCLLDDEIDELLKGLEAIDYEEMKALDMDPELSAVLNMDIDNFIV